MNKKRKMLNAHGNNIGSGTRSSFIYDDRTQISFSHTYAKTFRNQLDRFCVSQWQSLVEFYLLFLV